MRPIDADALISSVDGIDGEWLITVGSFRKIIGDAPTVSPDEVRGVGHWVTEQEAIDANDYSLRDTCSVCGRCDWDCTESDSFNYCPNCGARMKGDNNGTTD